MKVSAYNPDRDIPDLHGKVILVTGGTSGLGYQTILQLAKHNPGHIVFSGRNKKAADKLIAEVNLGDRLSFIECDMTSLASAKRFAETFLARFDRLDIFFENAGMYDTSGPAEKTADGYEKTWQVNYVAHALIDSKLLPLMERTAASGADVRLVILSSELHNQTPKGGIDYAAVHDGSKLTGVTGATKRYGASKLANLLRADEIARRHPTVKTVSLHPGVVATEMNDAHAWYIKMFMRVFLPMIKPHEGAYCQLWAATAPKEQVVSGTYYDPVGEKGKRSVHANSQKAAELWAWTEAELKKWE